MLKSLAALALVVALTEGCGVQTGSELSTARGTAAENAETLLLSAPEHGFQVATAGLTIEPGDDIRICEVVALPGRATDTFYVNRIETALSAHGEELIVSAARPDSVTAAIMDVGANVPCTRAGEAFGEELIDVVATQDSYHDERFPAGVGKMFQGGQKLAVEYHYVNDTNEPVPAKAKISFHLALAASIQHLARTANFANFTIYTPPGGQSSHLGECLVRQEMLVSSLSRRTQHFSTGFKVWRVGGERAPELLWQSDERGDSRYELLDKPIRLLAGEGFRFQCDFRNTTDRELRYGVSAGDETCMLNATFWPADATSTGNEGCLLFSVGADGVAR